MSDRPGEGRVSAVDTRVEVGDEDPLPRDPAVPERGDTEPLDAPGARRVEPGRRDAAADGSG